MGEDENEDTGVTIFNEGPVATPERADLVGAEAVESQEKFVSAPDGQKFQIVAANRRSTQQFAPDGPMYVEGDVVYLTEKEQVEILNKRRGLWPKHVRPVPNEGETRFWPTYELLGVKPSELSYDGDDEPPKRRRTRKQR